jgi:hypothetical protein
MDAGEKWLRGRTRRRVRPAVVESSEGSQGAPADLYRIGHYGLVVFAEPLTPRSRERAVVLPRPDDRIDWPPRALTPTGLATISPIDWPTSAMAGTAPSIGSRIDWPARPSSERRLASMLQLGCPSYATSGRRAISAERGSVVKRTSRTVRFARVRKDEDLGFGSGREEHRDR